MAIGLEVLASNVQMFFESIAPAISLILMILGGIIYGLAQTQPAEARGKWQTAGISMFIGGVIVMAIAGSATYIRDIAAGLMKPV